MNDFAAFHNACRNKVGHSSKRLAEGAARVLRRNASAADAARVNTYKCWNCKKWHVGRGDGRKRTKGA